MQNVKLHSSKSNNFDAVKTQTFEVNSKQYYLYYT